MQIENLNLMIAFDIFTFQLIITLQLLSLANVVFKKVTLLSYSILLLVSNR